MFLWPLTFNQSLAHARQVLCHCAVSLALFTSFCREENTKEFKNKVCFFRLIQFASTFSLKKQSIAKQQVYALTANDVSALNSSLCFDREEMPPMTLVLVWVINKTFTFSCVVAISTGGLNNAFQYLVAWLKARLIDKVCRTWWHQVGAAPMETVSVFPTFIFIYFVSLSSLEVW